MSAPSSSRGTNTDSGSAVNATNVARSNVGGTTSSTSAASQMSSSLSPQSQQPSPSPESYTEFALRCCTQEEIEGIRHHVLKFQSRNKVDPATQFDAPVRLHRKDPKNLQFQLTRREIEERKREREEKLRKLREKQLQRKLQREEDEADGVESKPFDDDLAEGDSELEDVVKEANAEEAAKKKAAQATGSGSAPPGTVAPVPPKPATDLTVIAPDGGARNAKKNPFKKKTRQVNVIDEAKRKLRYEEYYPWVMEDYDGKNTWVGSYEAGSSDSYVVFVFDKDGFKMIPIDKVYKFTPRNKYATLTLEEAESRMQKNSQVPRWLMKHMAEENQKNGQIDTRFRKNSSRLKTVVGSNNSQEGMKGSDNEDIDFDDEFDDDEEAPIMDDEEQNRDSERRMKREMLSANALGIERSYDEDDEEDDEEFADLFGSKKAEDKDIKKLRKTLVKSEMNDAYDTDDEENPYLSKSEDEDDENQSQAQAQAQQAAQQQGMVKQEPGDMAMPPKRSQSPRLARQVHVASIRQQFVKITAPPKVLKQFPAGEWNPNLSHKRRFEDLEPEGMDEDATPSKKIKLETLSIKEEPLSNDGGFLPTPSAAAAASSASPNANGIQSPLSRSPTRTPVQDDLLDEDDIRSVLSTGPIKIKDLLSRLKAKIHRHPENKNRIKSLVKKCLRQQDGLLYLKDGSQ